MLPALFGISTVIAIGLSATGASSQPAPAATRAPAAAPATQLFEYAVKFLCGRAVVTPVGLPPVAPGYYFTDVNVHNPNGEPINFRKKFALALINQTPGKISDFYKASLKPDEAFSVECAEITKGLGLGTGFATGFLVIQSPSEIDVVAVYTAAATLGGPLTMHLERVPKRP
jgi:hypothetical protein